VVQKNLGLNLPYGSGGAGRLRLGYAARTQGVFYA